MDEGGRSGRGRLIPPRWALTPALPAGSGGSTPSPLACGPCCWRCTWPSSTCRLPRPAGWTRSSSAPRPCAAWWASQPPWPRGRRRAHGGSGPEGQRSSSDCGGRTDGRTGPGLCPQRRQGPSVLHLSYLPHSHPLPSLGPQVLAQPLHFPEESGLPPFPFWPHQAIPQPRPPPRRVLSSCSLPPPLWPKTPSLS